MSMTDPVAVVVDALRAKGFGPESAGGGKWTSRCPAHQGSRRNLSIDKGKDGRCVLHCQHTDEHGAGTCDHKAIVEALGLKESDLFPGEPGKKGKPFEALDDVAGFLRNKLGCSKANAWFYPREDGSEHLVVFRLDPPDGKTYRPVHRVNGGWKIGDPDGPLPLYNLPALASADRVVVGEGEKVADAAKSLGLVATTSSHGAGKASKTDWAPLAGKDVVILPDKDAPGEGYARAVLGILSGLTPRPTVRVIRLPGLAEGGDLVDWLKGREKAEAAGELAGLIEATVPEDLDAASDRGDEEAETQAAGEWGRDGGKGEARWVTVAVGTVLHCHDRPDEPSNFGVVLRDLGERVKLRFREGEPQQRDVTIHKSALTFQDGRSLLADEVGEDGWPPIRLSKLPPVPEFPVEVFPPVVREFIRAVTEAIGCPPDFAGLTALVVAGAAIGRSASLRLKPGYFVTPSFYGMNIAGASSGKSPAHDATVRVMWDLDEALHDAFRAEREEYEAEIERIEALPKTGRPPKPVKPALKSAVLDDFTVESVAPQLVQNPRGLLISKDEGSAWLAAMNQYKKGGKGSDRQFFLSALYGKPIRVDRKGHVDAEPIRVPHPFLSVVGNLTPDMLGEISEGKGRSDGFTERLLFAFPDPKPRPYWSEAGIPDDAREGWAEVVRKLRARPIAQTGGKPHPHVVNFTPEAKSAWIAWYNGHVDEVRGGAFGPADEAAEGKLCDFAGRMALVLHLLQRASDPEAGDADEIPPLTIQAVAGAISLWQYFRAHHRRVRVAMGGKIGDAPEGARLILRWLELHPTDCFRERDLTRDCPPLRDDRALLSDGLSWLQGKGVVRQAAPPNPIPGGRGRKPSPAWDVNPSLARSQNSQNSQNGDEEDEGDDGEGLSANSANSANARGDFDELDEEEAEWVA